jgi:hypothetical protein
MNNPACHNCKNFNTWHRLGTLEDPPESGWECGIGLAQAEEICGQHTNEEVVMVAIASQCPEYSFFDWDEYHYQCDQAYAEYDQDLRDLAWDYPQ